MFEKIAKIIGKLSGLTLTAVAVGIVVLVFIVGIAVSFGGNLGKFKKVAKRAVANPTLANFNATAKAMPISVRKQYKKAKQTGAKPSDVITIETCVYSPYQSSMAAHFPGAVMAAGVLSILFSFFAMIYIKDLGKVSAFVNVIPMLVTVAVMVLRLLAGLISRMILKNGVAVYEKYVDKLDACLHGGEAHEEMQTREEHVTVEPEIPFARADEPVTTDAPVVEPQRAAYGSTFDAPERITVELADEEPVQTVEPEPVAETVMVTPQESEAEIRARARAEAMAQARAQQEQARAHAREEAMRAQAQSQAAAQAQAQPQAEPIAAEQPASRGTSSADEVIARIEQINREGASLSAMKEVALMLQKERAKPENKTPEMQRKLNESLASLLKAMSKANRK